jgi:CheY-like chemotaxis protein
MNPFILLVDDNAIQAATRKAILERVGHRVFVAPNGPIALEVLSNHEMAAGIGLIVTDHLMPGMDGPELVSKIRQLGIALPIVVLSGLPDAEYAYDHLSVTFRLKPFAPEALIALTRELLSQRMPRTA